jgi:hypothetical protein
LFYQFEPLGRHTLSSLPFHRGRRAICRAKCSNLLSNPNAEPFRTPINPQLLRF